jgi:hypothetical protein
MLQVYVVNDSYVLDECCGKCFLCSKCFMSRRNKGVQASPLGYNGPCVRGSRRGAQTYIHGWGNRRGAEAAFMGGQQARSTELYLWAGSRCGARGEAEYKATSIDALRVSLLKMDGQQARTSGRTPHLDVRALVSS